MRQMMERGISFTIFWHTKPRIFSPLSSVGSMYAPPFHPEKYIFTQEDYKTYISRRLDLFRDPAVARAALLQGGIVWQLALESNVSLTRIATVALDDSVFATEDAKVSEVRTVYRECIDFTLLETISGVYRCYTGKSLLPLHII